MLYIPGRARIVLTPELEHSTIDLVESDNEVEEARVREVSPFDEATIFTPIESK